jgi:CheY-like chemotaxis protein
MNVAQKSGAPFGPILFDGHMPETNGFAPAEQIRANRDLAGSTIMMLTSRVRRTFEVFDAAAVHGWHNGTRAWRAGDESESRKA